MLNTLLVGIVTYPLTSLLGYVVHLAIHKPWAGRAYHAHRAHHIDLYPPGRLISDTYLGASKQSTVYTFLLAFMPLLLIPVVLWLVGWFSWSMALSAVLTMGVVGLFNDIIHDSFHIRGHWLRRLVPGYEQMRHLHFIHHVNMRKNYGIYSFTWDRIFGTFRE